MKRWENFKRKEKDFLKRKQETIRFRRKRKKLNFFKDRLVLEASREWTLTEINSLKKEINSWLNDMKRSLKKKEKILYDL